MHLFPPETAGSLKEYYQKQNCFVHLNYTDLLRKDRLKGEFWFRFVLPLHSGAISISCTLDISIIMNGDFSGKRRNHPPL